jgi:adenylate cyclase
VKQAAKQLNGTVLFAVVRDYARIVNILDLSEAHTFLNDCADVIMRAVASNRGSLASISGDHLYFVFGDPATAFDNPKHAIKSALAIQNTADEVSVKWRHALDFLVEVDVGISTGSIIIGNLGPTASNQYALVGKTVTLAAELGRLCKECSVNVLVDSITYSNAKDYFTFRKVGGRSLLGFTERVELYAPM